MMEGEWASRMRCKSRNGFSSGLLMSRLRGYKAANSDDRCANSAQLDFGVNYCTYCVAIEAKFHTCSLLVLLQTCLSRTSLEAAERNLEGSFFGCAPCKSLHQPVDFPTSTSSRFPRIGSPVDGSHDHA